MYHATKHKHLNSSFVAVASKNNNNRKNWPVKIIIGYGPVV